MIKIIQLLILITTTLIASDLAIVANPNFPIKELTKEQLRKIYLKKVVYIDGVKIIAINLGANDKVRQEFEDNILTMNQKMLKAYWSKAHYHGVRPPKSVKSVESLMAYIQNIDGAIAYLPQAYVDSSKYKIVRIK